VHAVECGAAYAGVIFAGGPRQLGPSEAREVFAPVVGTSVRRVGVFGDATASEVIEIAVTVGLDVLQLSGGAKLDTFRKLRDAFGGEIWPVARVRPTADRVDPTVADWFDEAADAVVLDARVDGQLGGTGVALDWSAIAGDVARLRRRGLVVLAGGLRAENVAAAIALARPDIVDVSSGVELAPGIKDPERMRAFASAVRAIEV
jgi:phosphoribosylanthranilate isomerase